MNAKELTFPVTATWPKPKKVKEEITESVESFLESQCDEDQIEVDERVVRQAVSSEMHDVERQIGQVEANSRISQTEKHSLIRCFRQKLAGLQRERDGYFMDSCNNWTKENRAKGKLKLAGLREKLMAVLNDPDITDQARRDQLANLRRVIRATKLRFNQRRPKMPKAPTSADVKILRAIERDIAAQQRKMKSLLASESMVPKEKQTRLECVNTELTRLWQEYEGDYNMQPATRNVVQSVQDQLDQLTAQLAQLQLEYKEGFNAELTNRRYLRDELDRLEKLLADLGKDSATYDNIHKEHLLLRLLRRIRATKLLYNIAEPEAFDTTSEEQFPALTSSMRDCSLQDFPVPPTVPQAQPSWELRTSDFPALGSSRVPQPADGPSTGGKKKGKGLKRR